MAEEGSTADHMMKGKGISKGFKTVGQGLAGEDTHPEITGIDPDKKGPGRPSHGESSFKVVGPTAEEEQGQSKRTE